MACHGDKRVDNYSWLRHRRDPDVIAYLEAENRYTEEVMAPTKPLQEVLYREILGRIQETDVSVPVKRDDYFYYTRTEEGKAYSIQCRKHGRLDAAEEILLDANVLAEGQKYFRLGNFAVSPDHRLLAYSTDVEGDESYTIRVKLLSTGELLPDRIVNTYYTLEWANDNRTFFYTVLDETKRPYRAFRHELGAASDALVYQEDDGRFSLGLAKTRSRRFVFIELASPLTSELRYLEVADPFGQFRVTIAAAAGRRIRRVASRRVFLHPHERCGEEFSLAAGAGRQSFHRNMARGYSRARRCDHRSGRFIRGSSGGIRARARVGEDLHPRWLRGLLPLHRFSRAGLHRRRDR